jgi:hypothetical protein
VNQLLDRYLEVIELEPTTRQGYVGKIDKHIRPTIGSLQVGRLDAETLERLYAQLRKCREHCHGRKYKQFPHEHDADAFGDADRSGSLVGRLGSRRRTAPRTRVGAGSRAASQ